MSGTSGRDAQWWHGEGYASIDRGLWGAVVAALHREDREVRLTVCDAVIAAAPQPWDEDLDAAGVLAERLAIVRARPLPGLAVPIAAVLPSGWGRTVIRLAPDP